MGGSLRLISLDEEDKCDYEDEERWFSFSYSGLHWMKGEVLRGAIAYMTSLQDAKLKEGGRQFYINAGIKTVKPEQTDEEAFEKARSALESALGVVKRWIREPDLKGREFGVGTDVLSAMNANLDDVLDHNYRSREVLSLFSCPVELERVGMRGLYEVMRVADVDETVYSNQAQMMADILDKALPFMKREEEELDAAWLATNLRDLLRKCTGDFVIKG
ncbi:hypothetical protein VNI00_011899 [Paramarasmius palmivorus]|uniref:Uncharacterized protein n=1 Tax=Paramarasmius palmivorus TaxID=297713 RepID=A0AAW0CA57_9AGAR